MGVTLMRYLPIYCTSYVLFWTWEFNQGIPFCAFGNCKASPAIVKCVGIMSIIAFSEVAESVHNLQTLSPSERWTRKGKEIPAWVLLLDSSRSGEEQEETLISPGPMGCGGSHSSQLEHGAQGNGTFQFQVWTEQRSELMQKSSLELKLWGCWCPIKGQLEGCMQSVCTTILQGKTV